MGPQLGPKPVQVLDQFARLRRLSEASRFSLGIKPVRASMTRHTPPTKRMCPRGAYLCLTFQPLTMMKLANAKRVTMRIDVNMAYAAWKEKQTSDGVKGMEERDQMVNEYMDGKRRPKNPDPLGPPVSYMEDRGVFQPLTSPTNTFGLCRFYRARPQHASTLESSITSYYGACKEASAPGQRDVTAVCPHGFPRWDCYCFGFVAGAAYGEKRLPEFLSTNLAMPRMGPAHAYHAVPFCAYGRPKRSGVSQPYCLPTLRCELRMWLLSQCRNFFCSKDERSHQGMSRVDHSYYAIAGKCAQWAFA